MSEANTVEADTRRWLERAVIGLNLCPFAKAVHVKGQIHFAVSAARGAPEALADLRRELEALLACDAAERDTTLMMTPDGLHDFFEFNDAIARGERMIRKLGYEGVVQLASFHPHFQFAGTEADDVSNNTNRAPYPTFHLLREESIDRAVEAFPQAEAIFEANIDKVQKLGAPGWAALQVGPSR
jgi:uncharacterized protein